MSRLRALTEAELEPLTRLAVAAFAEYRDGYDDWPAFRQRLEGAVAGSGLSGWIAAERAGELAGAVWYGPPGCPRLPIYAPDWALIRILVVDAAHRGHGLGAALTDACLARARADGAKAIGLHTGAAMTRALALYRRRGFAKQADIAPIFGMPAAVYVAPLGSEPPR